jgi:hypothetical protein
MPIRNNNEEVGAGGQAQELLLYRQVELPGVHVNKILSWPEHHQGIAWWIAISSPIWVNGAWQLLKVLPVWGAKHRRKQRAIKIQVLEELHGDTNRLVLYLAREAAAIGLQFAYMSIVLAATAWITRRTLTVSAVVIYMGVMVGPAMLGSTTRVYDYVRRLMNYDEAIAELKRKQEDSRPQT